MPEPIAQIEKALDDLTKNMATKTEVIKLIDETVSKEKELLDASVKQHGTELEALKKSNETLTADLRKFSKQAILRSSRDSSGNYSGVFGSMEQAKQFGLIVMAGVFGSEKAAKQLEDESGITLEKDLAGSSNAAGGFLVPSELIASLIVLQERYGVFRRNTQVWPMSGSDSSAPRLASGLTVYCPSEGNAITKSQPTFGSVGLAAKKWATLTAVSSELTEDSAIAIGEVIARQIAQAFAKKEDEVAFLGDGSSTYFGHKGIPGALADVDATATNIKSMVIQGTGNTWAALTLADFEKMLGNLPEYADDGEAKFYCHRMFYYTVMVKLALAKGGVNAHEMIQSRVLKANSFLGHPVEFTQCMPNATGTEQIAAYLANLRMGSYLGDRRQMTVARSSEVYFANDQIGIRGTQRVAPAIYGVGDTTNPGPILALRTGNA